MREPTKRGYKYDRGGIPIKGRRSHKGYRDMFEDRNRSRLKTLSLKARLKEKLEDWMDNPERYAPLTDTEQKILNNLQYIQDREEWVESTNEFRRLCVGPTGSHERMNVLQYFVKGVEVSHPLDSTFKKRVKMLNDRGREKLKRMRRERNKRLREMQATAQEA